jgi:predicted dinucleotide-binding enzyme
MKIAILGPGKVAHTLGEAWQKAGHEVVLGARAATVGDPGFEVASLQDALGAGDIVVNAITGTAALDAITGVDTSALAGKTLLDVANAVTADGNLAYPNSSLAERLQQALPQARVVKSLNTAAIDVLADPSLTGPATVFVSGDHDDAKAQVTALLRDLGWADEAIIDLGGIQTARGPEGYFLLFFAIVGALRTPMFNLRITR